MTDAVRVCVGVDLSKATLDVQVRPDVRPLADAEPQERDALLTRRRQLIEMRTAVKNRLQQVFVARGARVRKSLTAHIAYPTRELDRAETVLGEIVRRSPIWRERDGLLQSAPGVGPVLSFTILAALPEPGSLDRKAIAALGGQHHRAMPVDAAEALQPLDRRRDCRRERGRQGQLCDPLIQFVAPTQLVLEQREVLAEDHAVLVHERRRRAGELAEPGVMGGSPRLLEIDAAAARQELQEVVPRLEDLALEGLAAPHEIAHALLRFRRNANHRELARAMQPR